MTTSISIELTQDHIVALALAAHEENITLNQFLVQAVTARAVQIIQAENTRLMDKVDNLTTKLEATLPTDTVSVPANTSTAEPVGQATTAEKGSGDANFRGTDSPEVAVPVAVAITDPATEAGTSAPSIAQHPLQPSEGLTLSDHDRVTLAAILYRHINWADAGVTDTALQPYQALYSALIEGVDPTLWPVANQQLDQVTKK